MVFRSVKPRRPFNGAELLKQRLDYIFAAYTEHFVNKRLLSLRQILVLMFGVRFQQLYEKVGRHV
jgi:hypothetical protein